MIKGKPFYRFFVTYELKGKSVISENLTADGILFTATMLNCDYIWERISPDNYMPYTIEEFTNKF